VPKFGSMLAFLGPTDLLVNAEPPALDTKAGRNISMVLQPAGRQVKSQFLALVSHVRLFSDKALTIRISCAMIAYDNLSNRD
jgi:hypothetical protein